MAATGSTLARMASGSGTPRLLDRYRKMDAAGWVTTGAVTALAALLRLPALGRPHVLVFDETYYVKDAWTLLTQGYEAAWEEDVDAAFAAGDVDRFRPDPAFVVHPQVGKWVIAVGLRLLGADDPAGWRLGVALAGIVTVLLVVRAGRRLLGSTALAALAGTVLAIDGSAIVHSRIAILDGILGMWLVAAFTALLVDRDRTRARLAAATGPPRAPARFGPGLGLRPWRILAGVLLGLALGTKWSAIWFVAAFGLLTVGWDAAARYRAGVRHWWQATLLRDAVPAFASVVVVAALSYLASWWAWFRGNGWGRHWAATEEPSWVPDALRSWWHMHEQVWQFHTGLVAEHPYSAHPIGWLLQLRPTAFWYNPVSGPSAECHVKDCTQTITSLGNPLIWWLATAALVACVWWAVRHRDAAAAAVVAGVAAGWLPWFAYGDRPVFTFYAVAFLPWLALGLAWAVGRLLTWSRGDPVREQRVSTALLVLGALVLAASVIMYPLWTGQSIPVQHWQIRQWLPGWV